MDCLEEVCVESITSGYLIRFQTKREIGASLGIWTGGNILYFSSSGH